MCVTRPLPTYMVTFSRCPRSPQNYKLGIHTLLLHAHATGHDTHTHMWHAKLFHTGNQRQAMTAARTHTHTHTHTHARARARPCIYTHLHAPHAQLPHDCPATPPTHATAFHRRSSPALPKRYRSPAAALPQLRPQLYRNSTTALPQILPQFSHSFAAAVPCRSFAAAVPCQSFAAALPQLCRSSTADS